MRIYLCYTNQGQDGPSVLVPEILLQKYAAANELETMQYIGDIDDLFFDLDEMSKCDEALLNLNRK